MTADLGTARTRHYNYPSTRAQKGAPLVERLWLRIAVDDSGCWVWTGYVGAAGYGRITFDHRTLYTHREVYRIHVGEIPAGKQIDHLCRNRACCNPDHLEVVTPQTNVRRGESPGAKALRRESCLHGHPYAEHGVMSCGRRICRLCRTTYMRLIKQVPYTEIMRRKRAGIPVVDLAAYFASQETAA